MLKGINRQIIEVTDTNSPYFERALLVVRPSCGETEADELDKQARRLVAVAGEYPFLKKGRRKAAVKWLVKALLFVGGGVAIGYWLGGI